eukprot:TRINITY_DN1489_c0_g1_i2.p1 TRINITY_DN1489_c0_g1~~TRINITY_DN1489_c0_g1_i2.p1  ORF type:complete len:668 (+),score=171.48 TRINITY_DN1489_c0_g1_i2:250-2253(+)
MSRPKIANRSDEVLRGDGVRLYGMDAEIEMKMQAKRDPEFERKLKEWLEAVSGEKLSHPDDIAESLKSGILLCKIVNIIWPGTIKTINTKPIALMEMENIGYYLKACWKLGVPSAELFVVSDLYLKKAIPSVLQNIYSLARLAQSAPSYSGPKIGPSSNHTKPLAKKWEPINVGGPRFVTDEEEDYEAEAPPPLGPTSCPRCGLPCGAHAKHCSGCGQKIIRPEATMSDPQLHQRLSEADKYREKLEKELKELKELYQKELNEKSNLKKELDQLKQGQKSPSVSTTGTGDRDAKSLRDQLEQESEQKKKNLKQISELQQENTKLKNDLRIQEAKVSKLEDDVRKAKSSPALSSSGGSSNAELQDMKRRLESATRDNTKLQSEINEKDRQIRSLQEQVQKSKPTPSVPASSRKTATPALVGTQSLRSMDQGMLSELQDTLTKILFSKPIDFPDVFHLNDFFKLEAGRRLFTQRLKQTMKSVPSLTLSENNFEILLYLINTVLQQMDLSDSKDLITAKVLMVSSCVLSRKIDGDKKEYIKQFIRSHEIWKNLMFWEEQFWDTISQKFKGLEHEEESKVAPLVSATIPQFASEMLDWGVTPFNCQEFMKDMCTRYNVDPKSVPMLKIDPELLPSHLQHLSQPQKKGSRTESVRSPPPPTKKGSIIKFWHH